MKKIILILTLIFLSSCSKSIYYAYEQDGTYCTFEVNKYKTTTYRAV